MFSETEYVVQIPENTAVDSIIVNVSCAETDTNSGSSQVEITLLPGNNTSLFNLERGSQVILTQEIDFESLPDRNNPVYYLQLLCTNRYNLSAMAQVEITIVNVNDNPFIFSNDSYTLAILENTMNSTIILNVSASDHDEPSAIISYFIANQVNATPFSIDQFRGEIFVANGIALDREQQEEYTLIIRATIVNYSESFYAQTEVHISLLDVNDENPRFDGDLYRTPEISTRNMTGEYLITVHATDGDLGENGTVMYHLGTNEFLRINKSTGDVYINSSSLVFGSFIVPVYAVDGGEPPRNGSANISIFIRPSPERVEFTNGSTFFKFVVQEDRLQGSLIGRIEANVIDENNTIIYTAGEVSYSINNTDTLEPFHISRTTGELHLLSTLDYEDTQMYPLTIEAMVLSDPLIRPATATVQITVTNVNDNPPVFMPAFYTTVVEEFTSAGTSVLTVSATDRDILPGGGGSIMYSLQDSFRGPFEINETSGVLTSQADLNIPRDYRFQVVASDGMMTSQAVVFISIVRSASVTPMFTRDRYIFTIPENDQGTNVGTVVALTQGNRSIEEYPHLLYQIRMPDLMDAGSGDDALFHIDPTSGNISALIPFDAETQNDYAFFVEVYNASNRSQIFNNASVEVVILDENDNRPVFVQSLYTRVITTAEQPGSIILTISATDDDSGSNREISYFLSPSNIFYIDRQSGNITVGTSPLEVDTHRLTVTATDGGSPTQSGTATVFIAIIPATPETIRFTEEEYFFTVCEDANANTLVGRVQAVDHLNMSRGDIVYSTPNITDCLYIDPNDGDIRVACTLNRETDASYELLVVANFTQTAIVSLVKVVINVLDVNDESPRFSLDVYARLIREDFGNESAVVTVEAIDPDAGQNGTVEYFFQENNNGGPLMPANGATEATDLFRISNTTGEIFLSGATVPAGDYKLTVVATDLGTPERQTATALVLICITRAPPGPSLYFTTNNFTVAEDEPAGTTVGTVTLQTSSGMVINPADYSDNLQFSITGGDTMNLFHILPNNGTIRTLTTLDRERAPSHVVQVLAVFSEFQNLNYSTSITIQVTDKNDNPSFVRSLYTAVIDDSYESGVTIVNISAQDLDVGRNRDLNFTIEPNTPFGVSVTSVSHTVTLGEIFVANTSNLRPGVYTFTITATDNGIIPLSGTAEVSITVNHAIPDSISFPLDRYNFSLIEDSSPGTFVGSVSVEQMTPALDNLVYSISGGTGSTMFHCDPSTGNITILVSVDRETYPELNLTITAFLPGEPDLRPATTQVRINILDVNDNRPFFDRSSYTLSIFTSNITTSQKLLTVSAFDDDEGFNQQLQYNISEPTLLFHISQTGDIFASSVNLSAGIYRLMVTATDMGTPPLIGSATVIITVREPIPSSIQFTATLYHFNTSEYTSPASSIGNVTLVPIPQEFQPFVTYETASINFSVTPLTGDIQTLIHLDYELKQNYTFTVVAHLRIPNENPLYDTTSVNVRIDDENDNTPVFVNFPTTLSFPENQSSPQYVRTIVATDADSGSNSLLRYEIQNIPSTEFILNSSNGQLFVAAGLDREDQEEYMVIVRVSDMGTPQRYNQGTITFTLLDINDNPPALASGLVYRVRERIQPTATFNLTSTDRDTGGFGNVRYTFQSNTYGLFTVNENTGVVTVQELDYESNHMYHLTLSLSDNWNPRNSTYPTNTVEQIITIEVINAPDNVPAFTLPAGQSSYQMSTDPRVTQNETMVTVSAQDADNDHITYSITNTRIQGNNGNRPSFAIDSTTGRIYSTGPQTFVPESAFNLTVQVQDDSEFTLNSTVQVVISVVPERLQFNQSSYTVSIAENLIVSSTLATLSIQPLSRSSNIQYRIAVTQPANSGNTFTSIGVMVGQFQSEVRIILNSPLDREQVDSYTVQVTATRTDPSETATTTLTVNIDDVNDNTPRFIDSRDAVIFVRENTPASTVITRINATDADIGLNSQIQYIFLNSPLTLPFRVDGTSGEIRVVGNIDFETTQMFVLRVQASDSGNPRRSATRDYTVNVTNVNDNYPQFAASAYFGEVYAGAPNNYRVHHIVLRVSDTDDPQNMQRISFQISIPPSTGTRITGYDLQVSDREPYYVVAVSIPDSAPSQLLEFMIEVTDEGGLSSSVPLYLSIFTTENLIGFVLDGVDIEEFLSCTNIRTSLCELRVAVAQFIEGLPSINGLVSFYNDSVQRSQEDTQK